MRRLSARLRWALCLVLLAAALGLGMATWRQGSWAGEGAAEGPLANGVLAPQGVASRAVTAAGAAPAVAAATSSTAGPGAGLESLAAQLPPEGLEVCGIGHLTAGTVQRWLADMVGARAWMKIRMAELERRADAGLARVAARLAAGGEREQVAARLLIDDVEGASVLAERGSDAMAYQMALKACGPLARASAPSCARLSAQRWAALDPTDARPWLRLLEEAHGRGDAVAVDAALAEAAARPHLSRGGYLLEMHVAPLAGLVPDVTDRAHGLIKVIGMDAARWDTGYIALARACRGDELQRLQRPQHCRIVARQVLAAAGDLLEATLAQQLAERAGVPPEQQAYDAATLKAAQSALLARAHEDGLDCAALARSSEFWAQRAAQGELALALSLLPPANAAARPPASAASRPSTTAPTRQTSAGKA